MNVFEKIKKERGMIARIYSDFNEFPASVKSHFELNKSLMLNDGPLPREEREWLAVCVSDTNKNKYCATHHKEALDKYKGKMHIDQVKLFLSIERYDQILKMATPRLQNFVELGFQHGITNLSEVWVTLRWFNF